MENMDCGHIENGTRAHLLKKGSFYICLSNIDLGSNAHMDWEKEKATLEAQGWQSGFYCEKCTKYIMEGI